MKQAKWDELENLLLLGVEDRISAAKREFKAFQQQSIKDFNEAVIAQQIGLQNVFNKFLELEKRQQEIEELLQKDYVRNLIKLLPTQNDIFKLFDKNENPHLKNLDKHFSEIKEYLSELEDRFTF